MMIAPDIRDSSEEDRRKYINDRGKTNLKYNRE